MCFSKPKTPDYGEEARKEEEARQAKIREGTDLVNATFSRYDDPYFAGIEKSVKDYYRPQVAEQFGGAKRALTYKFADNAGSSAANRNFGDLFKTKLQADQQVGIDALSAGQTARRDVEGARSNQINLLEAGSSLENVANQSAALADQKLGRPQFSPIGDLFQKFTGNLYNNEQARSQGYSGSRPYNATADFLRGGSRGSSRVIGG